MDFYSLDYIFAETQFTAGLQANLQQYFHFARMPIGSKENTVKSTYFCKIDVPNECTDHLAAQRVIDEGICHFTQMLKGNSAPGIKFTRIDVLKLFDTQSESDTKTYGLVVDYVMPAKKSIKSFSL